MDLRDKRISVLGDSISTFKGYTEPAGCFYGRKLCEKGGIRDVHGSWWMRVIDGAGGVLEKNSSFMGSCVAEGFGLGRSGVERAAELGAPEAVLVYMGANDAYFGVPPELFEEEYARLLARLGALCPGAPLFCATLMDGRKVFDDVPLFSGGVVLPRAAFSEIIRRSVRAAGARLVDLEASGFPYDAIDGSHPTNAGMATLAGLFLDAIRAAR